MGETGMKRDTRMRLGVCLVIGSIAAGAARGEDWNQWRGADRRGVAEAGPALSTNWPKEGPVKLWESEKMPSGNNGGFGSVSISGGKAYVFVNWKTHPPTPVRKLGDGQLRQLGWFPEKLPEDLLKAMEEARVSAEREALKPDQLKAWVDAWVAARLTDDEAKKKFTGIVQNRLNRGKATLALDRLEKLAAIKDKSFATQEELDKWYEDNGVPDDVRKEADKVIPKTTEAASDVVVCLNPADGKTVWKKEFPGQPFGWGSSSTPCVTGGRVYAVGGKTLYCLNAADGEKIWQAPLKGGEISSSALVVGDAVVVLGGQLMALAAADGKELWTQPKIGGNNPSPVSWAAGGKTFVLCNASQGLSLVEPTNGAVLWTVPGGGSGTPVVSNDVAVVLGDRKDVGLVAYRLSPEKAEKIWSKDFTDRGTTPIVHDGHIYIVGSGRACCVALADGTVKWEEKQSCEIASPAMADGKVLGMVRGGGTLLMFRASPEKYDLLAKASMRFASCSSLAISDGRLYARLQDGVACYDLTKSAP